MQQADQCVCEHPGFDADCDLNLACSLSCSNILSSTMALRQVYRGKVRGGIFQGFGWCMPRTGKVYDTAGRQAGSGAGYAVFDGNRPENRQGFIAPAAQTDRYQGFFVSSAVFCRVRPRRSISQPEISPSDPKRMDVVPFLSFSVPMSSC